MKRRKKSWEIILTGLVLTALGIYLLTPEETTSQHHIDHASFSVPAIPSVEGKNDVSDSIYVRLQKLESLKVLENFKNIENFEQFKKELENLKELEELKELKNSEELKQLEKELQKIAEQQQ
ncbi:hypothetical protein LQ318_08560 [Aliifodinibius salicampi]|uniref:Uncharacterized protein n=1 Tax=Fodinibius salicampi TaxID=1920655 RepID=A0ABT3PYM8_9BACT|nr:hypothetical protein [Fodinibius salicampi]MCW9712955.1 hypothetical protein [Fodinibius salicampi]